MQIGPRIRIGKNTAVGKLGRKVIAPVLDHTIGTKLSIGGKKFSINPAAPITDALSAGMRGQDSTHAFKEGFAANLRTAGAAALGAAAAPAIASGAASLGSTAAGAAKAVGPSILSAGKKFGAKVLMAQLPKTTGTFAGSSGSPLFGGDEGPPVIIGYKPDGSPIFNTEEMKTGTPSMGGGSTASGGGGMSWLDKLLSAGSVAAGAEDAIRRRGLENKALQYAKQPYDQRAPLRDRALKMLSTEQPKPDLSLEI